MSSTPLLQRIISKRMLLCCFTGFTSGMPLYVLYQLIPTWLRDQGVDLKTIGLFALISIPYVWKFLWAPFLDNAFPLLGRRRGWGLLTQVVLMLLLASLSLFDPTEHIKIIAGICFAIAFFSATQDIVIDAYRREILPDEELGFGNSLFVNAYRLSSLVPGSLALILADHYPWAVSHLVVASFMLVGIGTSLFMKEPVFIPREKSNFIQVIIEPIKEFLQRNGTKQTIYILLFMLFYKLGDSMATALATPFYLDLGFSKTDLASIVKVASLWSSIVGGFFGGLLMIRIGINRSLWYFGVVQMLTILGFAILSHDSKVLSIFELEQRTISNIESSTKTQNLSSYMTEGSDIEPIYINELEPEKLIAKCPELTDQQMPENLGSEFLFKEDIATLQTKCKGITHKIRLNVASKKTLERLFNEEEIEIIEKAKNTHGMVTAIEQLQPNFTTEKVNIVTQHTVLKMDSKYASAEELSKIPQLNANSFLLFLVVSAEYLGVGLGTAAFVSFIARSTNKAYTAAQFALLTSLSGIPRTFAASITGYLIEGLGYTTFFLFCTMLAIPGMILLIWIAPLKNKSP
jgi:MFS transporter, PAT family, beta-lactamase induction signal transducer AmpG